MAIILSNEHVATDIYHMKVAYTGNVAPGQFFMVRTWLKEPLLSRPLSVFNYNEDVIEFLYQKVGEGTRLLKNAKAGERIELQGPYGQGFPITRSNYVAVGGGIGIAPLYFACKRIKDKYPRKHLTVYLGFSDQPYMVEAFEKIADDVHVDVGGRITDLVQVSKDDVVITCGPEIMMAALCRQIPEENTVYVSLEEHMACGVGACLGCSREGAQGKNVRICKDGPVFNREVIYR